MSATKAALPIVCLAALLTLPSCNNLDTRENLEDLFSREINDDRCEGLEIRSEEIGGLPPDSLSPHDLYRLVGSKTCLDMIETRWRKDSALKNGALEYNDPGYIMFRRFSENNIAIAVRNQNFQ